MSQKTAGGFAPILATAVFYIVLKYGPQLSQNGRLRKMAIVLFILTFVRSRCYCRPVPKHE